MNEPTTAIARVAPEAREAAITPMQMLQIAVEQGADLDKLQKLMDLQERWEANEARKAYVAAINAFKAEPPTVVKNKRAGFDSKRTGDRTEYEYATLNNVVAAIGPALSKQGLSHRWETEQTDGGMIRVSCIVTHVLGHSEKVMLQAGADQSGSKNNIQAIGSTVSYLQRYTLLAATGLASAEMDNDGDTGGAITAEQKAELVALQQETKADTAKFLTYLGVASLDTLPVKHFMRAKQALEAKKGRAKK